jgi:hypothetical protein
VADPKTMTWPKSVAIRHRRRDRQERDRRRGYDSKT